jgi:hypothetical protein
MSEIEWRSFQLFSWISRTACLASYIIATLFFVMPGTVRGAAKRRPASFGQMA